MNYKEALDWLNAFEPFGMKLGLERITRLCKRLNNPQQTYRTIHVGGTNGKGSVCTIIASILSQSGYTVGLYRSPHLQRFSERIVVNGEEISQQDVGQTISQLKPLVEEMTNAGETPTYFEIVTAMAFLYFQNKNVDIAVIEVGLGGQFDATNIVTPLLSIITNISLEHQENLGDTVEKIAFEKAGIIKKNIPIITAAEGGALSVIADVAKEKHAPLTVVTPKMWKRSKSDVSGQELHITGVLKEYVVKTSLMGQYQGENVSLVLAAIEQLQMSGTYITDGGINEGIEKVTHPGRMEILGTEPLVILDGAHTVAGISALKETIENDVIYNRLILIMGILIDKKIEEMLNIIAPLTDVIVVTRSKHTRACDPRKLKEIIEQTDAAKEVVIKEKVADAVQYAKTRAKKGDLICITGSLFTVGEARDFFEEC